MYTYLSITLKLTFTRIKYVLRSYSEENARRKTEISGAGCERYAPFSAATVITPP